LYLYGNFPPDFGQKMQVVFTKKSQNSVLAHQASSTMRQAHVSARSGAMHLFSCTRCSNCEFLAFNAPCCVLGAY